MTDSSVDKRGTRRKAAIAIAVGTVTVLLTLAGWRWSTKAAAAVDRSVAVLPFTNLGAEPDSAYFVDGVHDAVISRLAGLRDLKVISRTSVLEYRDAPRNLRDIGQALGVAHVVEGSVQRAGGRVRVVTQLIRVEDGDPVWAETYDRERSDVFAIQGDIAEQVANGAHAVLGSGELDRLRAPLTRDAEAYDLYLRARELQREAGGTPTREALLRIETLLQRAVALDPQFAQAHAALARCHLSHYHGGVDTTPRRRDAARAAAGMALTLQPGLAEGHFALGQLAYYAYRDYDGAVEEFGRALAAAPNDAEAHAWIGAMRRRQARWEESRLSFERASELAPRDASMPYSLGELHLAHRRFSQALPLFERSVALAPANVLTRLETERFRFLSSGNLRSLDQALAALPAGVDPDGAVSMLRIQSALYAEQYPRALELLAALPIDRFRYATSDFMVPREFVIGQAHAAAGDEARARPYFRAARDRLEQAVRQEPDSFTAGYALAWLSLTLAYLGDPAADKIGEEALARLPVTRDAWDGPDIAQLVAAAELRRGRQERALDRLERLLGEPGRAHAHEILRNPDWAPARASPRFQKLIADHLPRDV